MIRRFNFYLLLVAASASSVWAEQEEEKSDETTESIEVEAKGVLRHGELDSLGGEYGTTITANGITWQLELPRWKSKVLIDPKYNKLAKSLNGKRAIVKGMLRRQGTEGGEAEERLIVDVFDLKAVPISVILSLESNDKGELAAIYLKGEKYTEVTDAEKAIGELGKLDAIVLECDSRLQYAQLIRVLEIAREKTFDVKLREREFQKNRSKDESSDQ